MLHWGYLNGDLTHVVLIIDSGQLLLCPGRGAEYCDQFLCLSVCPRAYVWNCWTDLHKQFLSRSPVAVARSSFGGVAIRYVLLVLRMTSRLAVTGRMAMHGRTLTYYH